jgi:hypothetical protein
MTMPETIFSLGVLGGLLLVAGGYRAGEALRALAAKSPRWAVRDRRIISTTA